MGQAAAGQTPIPALSYFLPGVGYTLGLPSPRKMGTPSTEVSRSICSSWTLPGEACAGAGPGLPEMQLWASLSPSFLPLQLGTIMPMSDLEVTGELGSGTNCQRLSP